MKSHKYNFSLVKKNVRNCCTFKQKEEEEEEKTSEIEIFHLGLKTRNMLTNRSHHETLLLSLLIYGHHFLC